MRLRKLAKLNALTSSSYSRPQAYACGFNQSPWDVMTEFSPPSSPLPPPPLKGNRDGLSAIKERSGAYISLMERDEGIDDITGQDFECTGSDGDDGGCADEEKRNDHKVEVECTDDDGGGCADEAKSNDCEVVVECTDNDGGCADEEKSNGREVVVLCSTFYGKNRRCMRDALGGDTLCEHHLALANKCVSKGSSHKKKKKSARMVDTKGGKRKVGNGVVMCKAVVKRKTDGKSWQCKREAMYENSLCEHHLGQDNIHIPGESSDKKRKKSAGIVETEGRKRNVRTKRALVAAADPSEIYYYSGFGPLCPKKRGNDKEKNVCDNNNGFTHLELEHISDPSKRINDDIVCIEDDDDDDEEV